MKIRILLSLVIILTISAVAFAATKALLSDQVTLTASAFSTGTVALQISKSTSSNPSSFTNDSIAGFTGSILPGETTTEFFWLKNDSDNVDFEIAAQAASVSGTLDPSKVTIAFTPVDNTSTISGTPTTSHTLSDWISGASLGNTIMHDVNNGRQRFRMDVTLDSNISSAGTVTFDFVFTGTETP